MKLKRAKQYKKLLNYLHISFGFREPYQVLLDEEIILEACKTKFDLVAGLERTLQGKVKPMVTQCTMEHLYRAKQEDAIALAKTFERRRCGHIPKEGSTLSAFECINSVVDVNGQNKHRYVVGTQKPKLRALLRKIPAVPIIYINRSVMIMEPMSPATEKAREGLEKEKITRALGPSDSTELQESTKKRKKASEPNPLSVKKKKVADDDHGEGDGVKKTRRKRGKKSEHTESNNGPTNKPTGEPGSPTHLPRPSYLGR